MKGRHAVLALAAAVTLTSAAAASPEVARQRIAFNAKILPEGTFVLRPLQSGALKRDSGRFGGDWRNALCRDRVRKGQSVMICEGAWTLTGRRGTLTIRERNEWVDIGNDGNGDGETDGVAVGTWKVARGTGVYAGVTGGGGSGHAGLGRSWNARYEGFLTAP